MIRKRKQKSKDTLMGQNKRRRVQDVADESVATDDAPEALDDISAPTFVKGASRKGGRSALVQSTRRDSDNATSDSSDPKFHAYQGDTSLTATHDPSKALTSTNAVHEGNKNLKSRAHLHIRSTAVFDFGGICKDYKESGYCAFGDDCIYAHIREDYMGGYEQDIAWEKRMKERKESNAAPKNLEENLDAVPKECPRCKQPFKNPVKTLCNHIFCKDCFLKYYKGGRRTACPVCKEETHGILNSAEELIKKAEARRERIAQGQRETKELAEGEDKRGREEREFDIGWSMPKNVVE